MGVELPMSGRSRSVENRQARRYRYRGAAVVRRLESDPSHAGLILDLSTQGCLLRLPNVAGFEVGAVLDIAVNSRMVMFRALGSVRHRSWNRRALGIAFEKLSQRGEADLLALIADLEAEEQAGRSGVPQITVFRYDAAASHR